MCACASHTTPHHAVLYRSMPYGVLTYPSLPRHAIPYSIKLCRTVPHDALPYHTMQPRCNGQHKTTPDDTTPYCAGPDWAKQDYVDNTRPDHTRMHAGRRVGRWAGGHVCRYACMYACMHACMHESISNRKLRKRAPGNTLRAWSRLPFEHMGMSLHPCAHMGYILGFQVSGITH